MYRHVWAGKIASGKFAKAMEWVPRVKEFYQKYDKMPKIETYLNMFGESGGLIFMADYKDFAAYQKIVDQVLSDPGYAKLGEEAANIFVEGSINTFIMRSV
jgi:hypothetical protein